MKWKVLLLNYDSEWVEYCKPSTLWFAEEAKADLLRKGFQEFQTKIVKCE